jgi:hypothetical protein
MRATNEDQNEKRKYRVQLDLPWAALKSLNFAARAKALRFNVQQFCY